MSRWWLRTVALLVPRRRRTAWLREWHAELDFGRGNRRRGAGNWAAPLEDAFHLRLRESTGLWRRCRPVRLLAGTLTDVRHAARALRHNPGPLLISALSFSLAIGATATMVAVVDAIDFRPLPYRDAHRLVQLTQIVTGRDDEFETPVSPELFEQWQARVRSYEAIGAASPIAVSINEDEDPLGGARVTADFFAALGANALVGRVFTAEEIETGAPVALISEEVWRTRFAGDPGVVGRTVRLSWAGEFRGFAPSPHTVVGVLPHAVRYPRGSDVWLPAGDGFGGPSDNPMLTTIGRLRGGVAPESARAEMVAVSRALSEDNAATFSRIRGAVAPLRDGVRQAAAERAASARFVLLLLAAFVLTLAVINLVVVFLVRASHHGRDLLVRSALGAPRFRLFTLTLAQSLWVTLAAGGAGIVMAQWGIRLADIRLAVSALGVAPALDGRVIGVGLLLSIVAGLLPGLLIGRGAGREGSTGSLLPRTAVGSGAMGGALRGGLVVAQVACALVLLNGAGVLTRDYMGVATRDLGFDADRIAVAGLQIMATAAEAERAAERVGALPGVEAVAVGGQPGVGYGYRKDDGEEVSGADRPFSYRVTPGYFRTLGIPLLEGRAFEPSDRADGAPVAVVSEMAAGALWPGTSALGKRLYMESNEGGGEWVTVVGVTGNERVRRDLRAPLLPVLYRPWGQLANERRRTEVFARAAGEPAPLVPEMRRIAREARTGEGWQGDYVVTMESIVGSFMDQQQFRTWAMLLFSAFGLTLAAMGIYGVVATFVSQRRAEIGVRVALGARPLDVLTLVARSGVGLAMAGVASGLVGVLAANRMLASLLLDDRGPDLAATVVAGGFLVAVVLAASYVPSRRALKVDPALSLRQ